MEDQNKSNLPDFLIIGAGKCGTTSLDNYLRQHPEIFIPPVKEPNFFGYELHTEEDFKDSPELIHYQNSVTNIEDYKQLFENAQKGQVKGETSNTYLYHKFAPRGIWTHNPDVKLIAIFRQPADRLWSRYMHLAREQKLPTENFVDCLDRSSIWWQRHDLIKEGFYYKNLSRYYDLFDRSRIKVYLTEEIKASGEKVLEDIFDFLGVDPAFEVNMSVQYNQSGIIKNSAFDKVMGNHGIVPQTAKWMLGRHYQKLKTSTFLQGLITQVRSKNLEKPSMDPEIRKILTHEVYGDDIKKLSQLIGKDLQGWMD